MTSMRERIIGKSRPHRWRDLVITLAALYVAGMIVVAQVERDILGILIVPLVIWALPAFLALGLSNKPTWIGRISAPAIVFALIAALMLSGRSQAPSVTQPTARDLLGEIGQDTEVLVSRQTADGVTNDDLDASAAEALSQYTLERMRYHTQRVLNEMDSASDVNQITQSTVLVDNGGQNIVVTRVYTAGINNAIQFLEIKDEEMVRVLCQSARGDEEVFIAGKCQDTVKEQLGFEFGGHF